jgi:ribokinase
MPPRLAVVGHVEWAEFARVDRVPGPGEVAHAGDRWEAAGGAGAAVAVHFARLAGGCEFFTALAGDAVGARCDEELRALGVAVRAGARPAPHRRVWVHVDAAGERTMTVLGARIAPAGADALGWADLGGAQAAFFSAGDADALRAARAARLLVATPRPAEALVAACVPLDVLVGSGSDPGEALDPWTLAQPPGLVVRTAGAGGGRWAAGDGSTGTWEAAPVPGPVADAYGCGDAFAAGLTYALATGLRVPDAVALAARCGAACLTGRGPYGVDLGRLLAGR